MARFKYNAGEEEVSDGFKPLPAGSYDLKITKAELGKSKDGTPMATVDYEVINSLQYNGKTVKFHRVTFIPEGLSGAWIAKSFLKAIGEPYKGKQVDVDTDTWVGKIIRADVVIEPYQGKDYNKIASVHPFEGGLPEPTTQDEEIPF
jgi:hypothetical protein